MQSLAEELGKLGLNLGLQVDREGVPEGGFVCGHELAATRKVVTSSAIESSVSLVGGSSGSVRAEIGMRSKISCEKKTWTEGSLPGRLQRLWTRNRRPESG